MKIRILRILAIIGFLLFFVTLIISVTMGFFLPPLLVSLEFAATARSLAITGAIFTGLSLLCGQIANILQTSNIPSKKKLFKYISKQIWTSLPVIFTALFFGYLTYIMLIDIPASFLHITASKEHIQLDAIATSAWPARKDLRKNCQYHLLFDAPKISSEIQYVCIDWNEWLTFRSTDYPITIRLDGQKSYYGYELRYIK